MLVFKNELEVGDIALAGFAGRLLDVLRLDVLGESVRWLGVLRKASFSVDVDLRHFEGENKDVSFVCPFSDITDLVRP